MECPRCQHQCPPGARFCPQCGLELAPRIASEALRNTETHGEFKPTTILFADIVASTELVSVLDPEEAMERLAPAVFAMRKAVEQFGGTVVHVLGDGIMALFGAPRIQEGHALLACRAALAIRNSFHLSDGGIRIRIGLHSGLIVSETTTSARINEREAYGVAIHIASRVQALAEPGTIYMSDACCQLVGRFCVVVSIGRKQVRGISQAFEIFELEDVRPDSAVQSFKSSHLTDFQHREDEFALLVDELFATGTGQARVIGLCGPAGGGKSRLCFEFAKHCRDTDVPVLEVRAHPYGSAAPLQPILELTRLLLDLLPTDDPASARSQVAKRIMALGASSERVALLVTEFLGLSDGVPATDFPSKARHAMLLDVFAQLVRARGRDRLVIIFEDLHWLDPASVEFLDVMCEAVAGTQILLLTNYRPTFKARWMTLPGFREVPLKEMTRSQTVTFVSSIIGGHHELFDLRQRIAQRCAGNPFFAEELIYSLVENGSLIGQPGQYRAGPDLGEAMLPVTVQAVIGERLDRLPPLEKSVLQVAAVIGRDIPYPVLAGILSDAAAELDVVLDHLCAAEILYRTPTSEGLYYIFRHPLIQEVAYSGQLKARRSSLHALVAPAMVAYHHSRPDEVSGLISYHYEAAGMLSEAVRFARRSAEWIGSMHPGQAMKQWQEVRRILRNPDQTIRDDGTQIVANAQIAWLGWREGMTSEQAQPYIQEAIALARQTDDTMIPLLLFVEARIGGASGGPADQYVAQVRRALDMTRDKGDPGRAATLYASLSQAYGWAGLFREALAANDEAVLRLPHVTAFDNRFLGYSVEDWTISLRARILIHLDQMDEARRWLDHMLAIEVGRIDPTVHFISHLGFVDLAWITDDARLAEEHAAKVAELAARHGTPYLRVFAFACAAVAKELAGDPQGAIQEFREGLSFMHDAKAALDYEPDMVAGLAECLAKAGQDDEALAAAHLAVQVARERNARVPEWRGLLVAGTLLLARGDPSSIAAGQATLTLAADLLERIGARALLRRAEAFRSHRGNPHIVGTVQAL